MSSYTPKRITAVACNLYLGGATTFLLNFLRVLRRRPESMRIVSFSEVNEHESDFAAIGEKVIKSDLKGMIYEDRLAWAFNEVAKSQPDAVLACLGAESFEMLRLVPSGVARVGVIQSHDPLPYAMARRYGPWLDAMVGVSGEICNHLQTFPEFENKKVVHIPYGIDFDGALSPPAGDPSQPLRVLYLGRLIEEQKRVSRLAKLIHRASNERAPISFTVAGSGPDEASFLDAIRDAAQCNYVGQVPNSELARLFKEHDVYILLSDYEGLPLSLLEAMGNGLVPVVSDIAGGLQEVVTVDVGIRVPVGDVEHAHAALLHLAQNREELGRLSSAASAKVRSEYSATRMVDRYIELFESLATPASSPTWNRHPRIPAPLGLNPFFYAGPMRVFRRWIKSGFRLAACKQALSSRA